MWTLDDNSAASVVFGRARHRHAAAIIASDNPLNTSFDDPCLLSRIHMHAQPEAETLSKPRWFEAKARRRDLSPVLNVSPAVMLLAVTV